MYHAAILGPVVVDLVPALRIGCPMARSSLAVTVVLVSLGFAACAQPARQFVGAGGSSSSTASSSAGGTGGGSATSSSSGGGGSSTSASSSTSAGSSSSTSAGSSTSASSSASTSSSSGAACNTPQQVKLNASGSLNSVPQSYNETRGLEIKVVSGAAVKVGALTLDGLDLGSAGTVGARLYDVSTHALVASASVAAGPGSNLHVPVSLTATLAAGKSYYAAFFVSDANGGSGVIYENVVLPYAAGPFSVVAIGESASDAYPANMNIFAPQITVETCGP